MVRAAALLAWLTLAASAAHAQAPVVPLPADVAVTPPGADVPPAVARFSGVWARGAWYGELPHVLVVERLEADGRAAVIYAVGESSTLYVKPAATRVTGRVEDGVLSFWLRDGIVTVEYRFDGEQLRGRYRSSYSTASVTLSRATLAEAARIPALVARTPRQTVRIPVTDTGPFGSRRITLEATVYRPTGDGPFPVVVFNHGSTGGNAAIVKTTRPAATQARFFIQRGFAVVAPMRRGRGASDGDYGESYGCASASLSSGLARAVEDIDGVLAWLETQPWADPGRLLMAGISRGGFLSVVYAGERPQRVKGVVNFVGGWTGEQCDRHGGFNAASFGAAGRAARVPMLWLYGDLDHYYGPAAIRSYHDAFVAAGGRGALHIYPRHGHDVANHAGLWETAADAYLSGLGLTPAR
jgi:dienelactone hydrolase